MPGFSLASGGPPRFVDRVKTLSRLAAAATTLILAGTAAHAQLPALGEPPWLGYYGAFKNKRYQFGITTTGKVSLLPMNTRGEPIFSKMGIDIQFGIEETMPDGKVVMRRVIPESLQSKEPASDRIEKSTITGKVTGDAAFELHVEQQRGIVFIGGRITDKGTLTKNPTRFAIRAIFPTLYPRDKKVEKDIDEKAGKDFKKKTEDDRVDLKYTDGKRAKIDSVEDVLASSKEVSGPGITSAQLEFAAYPERRFEFTASPNSSFILQNDAAAPLHEGFTINWKADEAKDKDGRARLAIEVK